MKKLFILLANIEEQYDHPAEREERGFMLAEPAPH